jgi:general nucleoside transport system permease protein
MWLDDGGTMLSSALRLTAPLAFAACGEYLAERAGTLNISVEGMMLSGAFGAVSIGNATGSPTVGLFAGALIGLLVGLVHANLSHRIQINTFVVGLVLNALALGLTSYLLQLAEFDRVQVGVLSVPGLSEIPLLGVVFEQRWPFYLLFVAVPLTWYLVNRTRWGLELRAAGENPQAADVSGIKVNLRRRQALLWCGFFSGLGGAFLSVGLVGSFNNNMTAGRGFIVIAAVIFGAWRLKGTILGCFLFGAADALRLALPALGVQLNAQLLVAAPYLLALAVMVLIAQSQREPKALGRPFERGLV